MPNNTTIHQRRSIRLPGYNYTQAGAYFVTICTCQRETLFGDVVGGEMRLNVFGEMVVSTWNDLPNHISGIELGPFVVMPNHVHAIIWITLTESHVGAGSKPARADPIARAGLEPAPTDDVCAPALSEMVRQLKTFSARRIIAARGTPGTPIWQRNYYEHIVRSEEEYERICAYILDNPGRWGEDAENPKRRL